MKISSVKDGRTSPEKEDKTSPLCEQFEYFTQYTSLHGIQFVGRRHSSVAKRYASRLLLMLFIS